MSAAGEAQTCSGNAPFSLLIPADTKTPIERGYDLLYNAKFEDARAQFSAWHATHPGDPLSDVSIAISYLFEELYHHNVLTSEFFLDNRRLFGGIEGKPDGARTRSFNEAYQRGREQALRRLKADPNDANALFALALATGSRANYSVMLEKQQAKGLRYMKEHENHAKRLLELQPDAADAWLAIGSTNYLIGALPGYLRLILWFGRITGNKELGFQQLQIAAEKGHYLRPFAKIFLALAAMREKKEDLARKQLSDLIVEFPGNPMFADELAKLNKKAISPQRAGGS
jgi:hypothetical protein